MANENLKKEIKSLNTLGEIVLAKGDLSSLIRVKLSNLISRIKLLSEMSFNKPNATSFDLLRDHLDSLSSGPRLKDSEASLIIDSFVFELDKLLKGRFVLLQ